MSKSEGNGEVPSSEHVAEILAFDLLLLHFHFLIFLFTTFPFTVLRRIREDFFIIGLLRRNEAVAKDRLLNIDLMPMMPRLSQAISQRHPQ